MPVGVTTEWKIDKLGCLTVNGFVDHVYYKVECKEWIQIETNKTGSGDPVGIGTTNVDKVVPSGHTHHPNNPRVAPTGVGQTEYVHHQKTYGGKIDFPYHTDSIIPYDDLTESKVLEWVKSGIGTVDCERIEESISPDISQYGVDAIRVVRTGDALPWN